MEGRRWNPDLAATYDRVARAYADQFFTELDRKPFDRELLDRFAAILKGRGRVCDVGCGPGHVGRYLAERGVDVFGLDLSLGMVALARDLNPAMRFGQGDMLALDFPDGALGGIVAFYSLIHLERAAVTRALAEMARVLIPGGALLLAFHGGEGEVHAEDWFGCGVSIDATLFQPGEMAAYMEQAGFEVEEIVTREPYEFEYPSQRVYARGTKRP
ncbi:MAG: class I SAM-dependent methyltransferase [Candidatus Rokubacteria bacterium]|nr:class I SAM-dependent methyltransferase [Candidatus Rokubacteria bacterium]